MTYFGTHVGLLRCGMTALANSFGAAPVPTWPQNSRGRAATSTRNGPHAHTKTGACSKQRPHSAHPLSAPSARAIDRHGLRRSHVHTVSLTTRGFKSTAASQWSEPNSATNKIPDSGRTLFIQFTAYLTGHNEECRQQKINRVIIIKSVFPFSHKLNNETVVSTELQSSYEQFSYKACARFGAQYLICDK